LKKIHGQIYRNLGLNHTDKLYDDFTTEDVNKFVLSMKKNKATGCDDIPAEAWNLLVLINELKFEQNCLI
jgi:hypothetical protein